MRARLGLPRPDLMWTARAPIQEVMEEIGWDLRDPSLRDAVAAGEGPAFDRLELLGDAVVDAILLPWLYAWSTGTVAVIAGARQHLASDASLDHLSILTGLHERLPRAHRGSSDHRADLVEAAVGAAFADGGWAAATTVCENLFGAWLDEPSGVTDRSARVDVQVTRSPDGGWTWRRLVWRSGADGPMVASGVADDPLDAELDAITDAVSEIGRVVPTVWVEVSPELRAEMDDGHASPVAGRIGEVRALLAGFDGVWLVPADRLDTSADPWSEGFEPDGTMSDFESRLGLDLARPALERLALHPSEEQRRLAFIGNGILKAASTIRAFDRSGRLARHIHASVQRELSLDRLQRTAAAVGLVDLVFPGARPADPVAVIRAALGAAAVDAGPEHAVRLAGEWLDDVRVEGATLDHLTLVRASYATGQAVEVELVTADWRRSWRIVDEAVGLTALAVEGMCAALDSIERPDEDRPILLDAPRRVVDALAPGQTRSSDERLAAAVARFLARVDARCLRVVWHRS